MSQALIVIDVQNDFCPGGSLAVPGGDEVVAPINALMQQFETVILTQDWHPAGHSSFATSHPPKAPFEMIEMPYGPQVLWPDHCVQGSEGAQFHPDLNTGGDLILRKGFRPMIDSYSGFFENDQTTPTGLEGYLRNRGVSDVTLAGLATDFCVAYTALDAARLGFRVSVNLDACRAIDLEGSLDRSLTEMRAAGIQLKTTAG
jgi:nicotinamidase/pyrazinamidase